MLLLICNGDFDQARTRYLIFMHLSGCQTTWKSLPRAWCKASCLESLLSKEVSPHQERDPSRYLFCLTTISGTPPRDLLIPFHLPPRHVVSAAHSSMGTFLTNHRKMMAEFSWDTPPPCSCSSFREKHPNIGGVNHPEDGRWHVASPLDALHVSKRLRFLLGTSAKTLVYPALSSYIEETWAEVQHWAQRHSVPNVNYEDWRNFVRDQWSQHVVSSRTPLSFDDIKYIKSVLTGFVVQGRDHAPNHLHIFCPLLYWRILKSTFGDEEVYTRSLLTPNQAQDFLATMTRKPWLKPYRWGVQEAAKLPCSYLLLKQKKNFLKARPIISYKSFASGRLFQAASSVLNMMLPVVFPSSYGHQSLPEIFQELHQYLSNVDEDIELMEFNQDLVGFFSQVSPRIKLCRL